MDHVSGGRAIWGPHLVEDSDRVTRWCADTLGVLTGLAARCRCPAGQRDGHPGGAGVPGARRAGRLGGGIRPCPAADLPAGFAAGWRYTAPVVSMPVYLDYLLGVRQAGGELRIGDRGLAGRGVRKDDRPGHRELHRDRGARPGARSRGHPVPGPGRGGREPGPDRVLHRPARGRDGLRVPARRPGGAGRHRGRGRLDRPSPTRARRARILRDCATVNPRLATARIIEHRVGLRPPARRSGWRPSSGGRRRPPRPLLVHNYGHGGAGVTLSWGCARGGRRPLA